jgi:hypothetical protein
MKKTTKKLTAIMAAMLTVASVGATTAMPVFAETVVDAAGVTEASANTISVTKDGDKVTKVNFDKKLTVDDGTTIPDTTFTFTMTGAEVAEGTTGYSGMTVYSGSDSTYVTGTVSSATVTFEHEDTSSEDLKSEGGDIVLTKQGSFDLTGLTFKAQGVYRFEVKETAGNVAGMTYSEQTQTLDLFVLPTADNSGFYVAAAACYNKTGTNADTGADVYENQKMPIEFSNTMESHKLTVTKTVTGAGDTSATNQFPFVVNIAAQDCLEEGSVLTGTITRNGNSSTPETVSVYVGDADTEIEVDGAKKKISELNTFNLAHGDTLVINGIFEDTTYTVTEALTGDAATQYTTTTKSNRYDDDTSKMVDDITGTSRTTTAQIGKGNNAENYYNYESIAADTGIALTITPIAIAGGLAGAGVVAVVLKRKLKK